MKRNMKSLLLATSVLFAFGFTACDETIDVDGPDIDFTFNYDEINTAAPSQRSFSVWQDIVSETVPGENVVSFLEEDPDTKQYADAVVAATIKDGKLTVSGGTGNFNFTGVDSVKITYQLTGSETVYELVIGAPETTNPTVVNFNSIKITKDQALTMMENEKVVTLKVKINPIIQPNCFAPGAVYTFNAKTKLSVKVGTALGAS